MANMFKKIFILCIFSNIVNAADVNLEWDPMLPSEQWTAVRIYERTGTTFIKVAEVPCPGCITVIIKSVVPGQHYYIARSTNGQEESNNSNEVSFTALVKPTPPTNVRFTSIKLNIIK